MRIFLSSTYLDLATYRDAASRALEQLGQQVGRMEVFGARPTEPAEACYEEIDKCSIFIGIYAHRYGFVPTGAEMSITELEFEHARSRSKQIFCFLADENQPWPPALMEHHNGRDKLLAFKKRVRSIYTCAEFTTEDNLASSVATSVGRFLAEFTDAEPKNPSHDIIEDALITGVASLSRNMAALFVDLMRLLSVVSSPSVRSVNAARYDEFLEMADQRLLDLRSTYILFSRCITPKLAERLHPLDSQLSWLLLRLRRGLGMNKGGQDICARTLYEVSQWIDSLCGLSLANEYAAIFERGQMVVRAICPDLTLQSIEEVFEKRLVIQSALVDLRGDIKSIIEDRHLELAVDYFCADRLLLSMCPLGSRGPTAKIIAQDVT